MDRYTLLDELGEGSFGVVRRAERKHDGALYAIKMSPIDAEDGIPSTTLREMSNLLLANSHPYVIGLTDVFLTDTHVCLVMEHCDHDLSCYMRTFAEMQLPRALIVKFTRQLLGAVSYCHSIGVVHRDIKPRNMLVDARREVVKIGDFGLTRHTLMDDPGLLTPLVVTLWYRAPELLLGTSYDWTVDIWAIGCVLGEMATGSALFPGDSQIDTIFRIFRCAPCRRKRSTLSCADPLPPPRPHGRRRVLGTPTEGRIRSLPEWAATFPKFKRKDLHARFLGRLGVAGLDLLERLLEMNRDARITAKLAEAHAYVRSDA